MKDRGRETDGEHEALTRVGYIAGSWYLDTVTQSQVIFTSSAGGRGDHNGCPENHDHFPR
jgi:hypothetical protein